MIGSARDRILRTFQRTMPACTLPTCCLYSRLFAIVRKLHHRLRGHDTAYLRQRHCLTFWQCTSSRCSYNKSALPQAESRPLSEGLRTLCFPHRLSTAAVIHPSHCRRLIGGRQPHGTSQTRSANRAGGIVALRGHNPHGVGGRERLPAYRPVTSIASIRYTSITILPRRRRRLLQ